MYQDSRFSKQKCPPREYINILFVFIVQGLPLDGEELLPYCYQGLESVLPLVENPPLQYLPRSNQTTVEVKHFIKNYVLR